MRYLIAVCGLGCAGSIETASSIGEATLLSARSTCDEISETWSFRAETNGSMANAPSVLLQAETIEEEFFLQLVYADGGLRNMFSLDVEITPLRDDRTPSQTTIGCNDPVELEWTLTPTD